MVKDIREITKVYVEKVGVLKKHNQAYHNKDKPSITDLEYDNLKKEILNLEETYSFLLKKFKSVSNLIGAPIENKFKKGSLSLTYVNSLEKGIFEVISKPLINPLLMSPSVVIPITCSS